MSSARPETRPDGDGVHRTGGHTARGSTPAQHQQVGWYRTVPADRSRPTHHTPHHTMLASPRASQHTGAPRRTRHNHHILHVSVVHTLTHETSVCPCRRPARERRHTTHTHTDARWSTRLCSRTPVSRRRTSTARDERRTAQTDTHTHHTTHTHSTYSYRHPRGIHQLLLLSSLALFIPRTAHTAIQQCSVIYPCLYMLLRILSRRHRVRSLRPCPRDQVLVFRSLCSGPCVHRGRALTEILAGCPILPRGEMCTTVASILPWRLLKIGWRNTADSSAGGRLPPVRARPSLKVRLVL
jgi:hypothetical protein